MKLELVLQNPCQAKNIPSQQQFSTWITAALNDYHIEITVRIVNKAESQQLNKMYRGKDKPTNILSFPFDNIDGEDTLVLGDLVICAPLVVQEAQEQGKDILSHWAHLTVHGTLHLLGYDHESDAEAIEMESLEIHILTTLGFPDPYRCET